MPPVNTHEGPACIGVSTHEAAARVMAGTHTRGSRRAAHLLCACLTVSLGCAGVAWHAHAAPARTGSTTAPPARKLDAVEERIRTAETWIRDARRTESQSTRQLRDAETRLGAARAELMRLREAQAGLRKETERLDVVIAAGESRRRDMATARQLRGPSQFGRDSSNSRIRRSPSRTRVLSVPRGRQS